MLPVPILHAARSIPGELLHRPRTPTKFPFHYVNPLQLLLEGCAILKGTKIHKPPKYTKLLSMIATLVCLWTSVLAGSRM